MDNNRKRVFSEVVSIDAWHKAFSADNPKSHLHADVVFREARLGGEHDSPVTFRLSIRRAELIVKIGVNEPIKVDPSTVQRFNTITKTTKMGKSYSVISQSIKEESKSSSSGFRLGKNMGPIFNISMGKKEKVETVEESLDVIQNNECGFSINNFKTVGGDYCWMIGSVSNSPLEGPIWNSKEPCLSLIGTGNSQKSIIEPSIYLEIRCKREDLIISDIELKSDRVSDRGKTINRNKIAAAEALIRHRLTETGLESGDMDEKFSNILIAVTVSDEV